MKENSSVSKEERVTNHMHYMSPLLYHWLHVHKENENQDQDQD